VRCCDSLFSTFFHQCVLCKGFDHLDSFPSATYQVDSVWREVESLFTYRGVVGSMHKPLRCRQWR
jgi:hypothetical protein